MNALKKCKSLFLVDGCVFWPTVYIAARILYWCEPWHARPIENFNRIMGNATQVDLLVSARTGIAMMTVLVWVPLLLLASWLLVSFCFGPGRKYEQRRRFTGWMSAFAGVGMIGMTMDYIAQFGTDEEIWLLEAQTVPLCFVACTLLWCLFLRLVPEDMNCMDADGVKQFFLCGLMLAFPVHMLARFQNYTAIVCGVSILVSFLLCIALSRFKGTEIERMGRTYAGIPLLLMLPAMLLYLEIGNILNQYGIFVGKNHGPLMLVALVCIVASIIISGTINNRMKVRFAEHIAFNKPLPDPVGDWRRIWYPLVICGFALLAGYVELQTYVGSDFFERANRAVSVTGFLNFGQLPAIETHGAHMGIDYWGGILWGLINGDSVAACFIEYNGITLALTSLLFYYLLCRCIGKDAALVCTLVLPVVGTSHSAGDWYCHIAFIPVLALLWAVDKPGFRRYALFWGAAAFSVLWRGDIGLSVGVGAVLVMTAFILLQKSWSAIKQYAAALGCVGGGLAFVLVVLCLIKGINPVSRLREFMELMAGSNQNWAYEGIGVSGSAGMAWTFLITPLLILLLVGLCILRLLRKQTDLRAEHWMFFAFSAAYYLNFPRTLVRHSLMENIPIYCLAMGMWAIALGVWLLWRDRDPARRPGRVMMPAVMVLSLMISALMFNGQLMTSTTLFTRAHNKLDRGTIVFPQLVTFGGETKRVIKLDQTVERVVLQPEMRDTANGLKKEMDKILQDGETWLDFTNQSALYSLLGRHSPVYVNQSPGLLSGEYSQECFIEQIEKQRDQVPAALLPQNNMLLAFQLDGVQNSLRYYRVAEYIFNNYVPYKTVGNFAIWVHPERLEQLEPKQEQDETGITENRLDLTGCSLRASNGEMTLTEEGGIRMVANGNDPILDSFQSVLKSNGIKGGRVTMTVYYTSDTDGDLQLFYAEPSRNYEESKSIHVPVRATDTESAVQLVFDWNTTLRLRLDTPAGSDFTITGISSDAEIVMNGGYNYGSMNETHTYWMGEIARLWGEQDEDRAWENKTLAKLKRSSGTSLMLPEGMTGGENGRYVKLVIRSEAESTGSLQLVGVENKKGPLAIFNFDIAPGTHTYLFRVSCDSNWYSGEVDGIRYAGPGIQSVSILEGD